MPRSEATAAYLRRLGVEGDLPPTYDTLVLLHRAHLDAVPYENLATMLGRPPSVDPAESLARVGARRPGRLLLPPERRARDGARRARVRAEPAARPRVDRRGRPRRAPSSTTWCWSPTGCPPTTTPAVAGGSTSASATRSATRSRSLSAGTTRTASATRSPRSATTAGRSGTTVPAPSPASRSRPARPTSRWSRRRTRGSRRRGTAGSPRSWSCSAATTTGIDTVRGCL